MPVAMTNHGCGTFPRNGNMSLVVFGGTKSVLFLDLANLTKGWYSISGIWLGARNWYVSATLINRLDETGCDLSFVNMNSVMLSSSTITPHQIVTIVNFGKHILVSSSVPEYHCLVQ
jgi:hypothetical protein